MKSGGETFYLQDVFQLITNINIFLVIVDLRVMGNEGVLRSDVDGVVDLPVDVSDLPGWMEETLEPPSTNTHTHNYAALNPKWTITK